MRTPRHLTPYMRLSFPVIFRVSLRVTGDREIAEDLCHEAFIKLMERPDLLPDLDQCKYWLIRVVKNLSLNHEKRKERERVARARSSPAVASGSAESGEKQLLQEETRGRSVQRALDSAAVHPARAARVPRVRRT